MNAEELEKAEALEDAGKAISKDEARRSVKLWFAVLGSPLAWAGHLGGNYSLEEWFACSKSAHEPGEILGVSSDAVSILFNTAMLAVALASGLVALHCWRQLKGSKSEDNGTEDDGTEDDQTERARWMAFAGMVEGALFVGIILLGYLPTFFIGVCETTP